MYYFDEGSVEFKYILFSKTASVVTFLSLSSHLFNTVPDYFVKDFILWNTYWGYIAVILQDDL